MTTRLEKQIKLERLGKARYVLENMLDALRLTKAKVKTRNEQQVMRRATAIASARWVKRIQDSVDMDELFEEAERLHERQEISKVKFPTTVAQNLVVGTALSTLVGAATGGVSDTVMLIALASVARAALRNNTANLGVPLPRGLWNKNPLEAWQKAFPASFKAAKDSIAQTKETLNTRISAIATNAAKPGRRTSRADMKQEMKAAMKRTAKTTAKTQAETQNSSVSHGLVHELMEDAGVERRRLVTRNDPRVDRICLTDAAAGWLPINDPYPSGAFHPPQQHPNCRCHEEAEQN